MNRYKSQKSKQLKINQTFYNKNLKINQKKLLNQKIFLILKSNNNNQNNNNSNYLQIKKSQMHPTNYLLLKE